MTDLRYPIGRFNREAGIAPDERDRLIAQIAEAPAKLRAAISGLSSQQLDTPYRPEGWTVRQVIHHLPDSHLNSYIRFKLALTEQEPTIKAYDENLWAELPDTKQTPVETSLQLLESLHQRWIVLLRAIRHEDWMRTYRHPKIGIVRLDTTLGLYAWHGRHHVAHITSLRERMGWK